jgi:hypothetical protein
VNTKLLEERKAYIVELRSFNTESLMKLAKEAYEAELVMAKKRLELEEANRSFNQPSAMADFEFWAKAAPWTLDESIALSLGRDPRIVNWESVKSSVMISPFAKRYSDRRLLFRRGVHAGQIYESTIPTITIAWMDRLKIEFPDAMRMQVEQLGNQIADWKSLYDRATEILETNSQTIEIQKDKIEQLQRAVMELRAEKEALENTRQEDLGERERSSLLKIIYGISVAQYDFNASLKQNTATAQIVEDLAELGLSINVKTVRKYLREAWDQNAEQR